jgi:hypothetical protein
MQIGYVVQISVQIIFKCINLFCFYVKFSEIPPNRIPTTTMSDEENLLTF